MQPRETTTKSTGGWLMYARTSYSADEFPSFIVSEGDRDLASDDFYAGAPVCAPPRRRIGVVPYSTFVLLLVLTVGAAFAADDETRLDWTARFERVATSMTTSLQLLAAPAPAPTQSVASVPMPMPAPVSPPQAAAIAQPLPEVTVQNAPGDTTDEADVKTREKTKVMDAYAPPPPSSDPLRRKAEAAGLHPDLSRAVLSRLTPADYRNAAQAIEKALKTVPDDGALMWPRTKKAGTAVFTVHFVEGAGHDCRRYVVTITKDRWTSTALPMEKCGVKVAFRNVAKEKSVE